MTEPIPELTIGPGDSPEAPSRGSDPVEPNPLVKRSAPSDIRDHTRNDLTAWERVSFDCVHAAMAVLARLVGPTGVFRFGQAFAALEWAINYKRRRRYRRVVREMFPEGIAPADLQRASREWVQYNRCNKLFFLLFDVLSRKQLEGLIRFARRELLDEALARGSGVYVAMSHVGPYQIGGMFLSRIGYRMAAVRDPNESGLTRYVQRRLDRGCGESARMKVFFSGAFPRVIFRCLKEGYVLGSALDVARVRSPNLRSERVMLFGRPREFLTGPLHVAVRCRVPILQAFVVPERDFRYRIEFHGPLYDPAPDTEEDEAVRRAMTQYVANLEAHMRGHPCHITRI
jgi:lauroyl/myristoyl acyltransferase